MDITESLAVYIPVDRREALIQGKILPDRVSGAALFADISGFTPLTEALARDLGPQRGAEELTRHLNQVYDGLINTLYHFGGSAIGFSGDAMTCWFDQDTGRRATACGLAMQKTMLNFSAVPIPSGKPVTLAMKAAIAAGPARRFLVGNPNIQLIEVLAGKTLDHLAAAEHHAEKGEVVLDSVALKSLGEILKIRAIREGELDGERFGVIEHLTQPIDPAPWPDIPPGALSREQSRPWLLPAVYERLCSGMGDFLAELRPVVSLFLRFTGINYDDDPAAGEKLDAFIRNVQRIMNSYDGSLVQLTIGDKGSYLQGTFGAPLAHEDDSLRALSAAMEMKTLPQVYDFIGDVQIGVSQGYTWAGAYGGSSRRTYGVMGDNVNLTARLMQAAAPGQVLASRSVYQAAVNDFEWKALGAIRVKGKAEPVEIFTPEKGKSQRGVQLTEPRYSLPMVGRQEELSIMEKKSQAALRGKGQVVGISAEAGLGKSRLVSEVLNKPITHQFQKYAGECQSYGTITSYLVWKEIWRDFFGLNADEPAEDQIGALAAGLRKIDPGLLPRMPLLSAVLNLSIPDNDLTRSFDAKLRKSSLEALLVDCVRVCAREKPLLLVLEDCHWLDPLSHDLLESIGKAITDLSVYIIMTYRPPEITRLQAPRMSLLPYFSEIRLSDFTTEEAESLIHLKLEQFFGSQTEVPAPFIERITGLAEGNPFYIEELLNYLNDRGVRPQDQQALAKLELPTSLHSLILSRIDRVTENQKTTLKVASVIGRLFKVAMLWGVYPSLGDLERVKADLMVLSELELTIQESPEPELMYLFKHLVTQEVAYESLPYATRAVLHEQVGGYIEKTNPNRLKQFYDLLAYHYERSLNDDKKREYMRKAGESAQADYANAAAIDYYRRLLPLLNPDDKVEILRKLGSVLELTGKWDDAKTLYEEAIQLAERISDLLALAWCQVALAENFRKKGAYAETNEWLEKARTNFETLDEREGISQVLKYFGTINAQKGIYDAATDYYEQSLAIERRQGDKQGIGNLLSNLGIVARFQGNYELARARHEEALAIRRESGDRLGIAHSLNNLGNVAMDQGYFQEARDRLEEALKLRREMGDRWAIGNTLNNLGNVARSQRDLLTALTLYRESLIINRELGDRWALAYLLEDSGILAVIEGFPEFAIRLVAAASRLREEIGAPLSPAEKEKLEASLKLARESLSEAVQEIIWTEGYGLSLDQALQQAMDWTK